MRAVSKSVSWGAVGCRMRAVLKKCCCLVWVGVPPFSWRGPSCVVVLKEINKEHQHLLGFHSLRFPFGETWG